MPDTAVATTHQAFTEHYLLAAAWVRYCSPTGRATERQILKIMSHSSTASLRALCAERGVHVYGEAHA